MSDRAAFISTILDNPADDTARLVFADWLEEHGEPERAEFIRCQIEAATAPGKSGPGKRAAALLKKHEKRWRDAVGMTNWGGQYARGFLTNVRVANRHFVTRVGPLFALEPAELQLDLHNSIDDAGTPVTSKWLDVFAKNPALRAVRRIDLNCGGFGEHLARLMKSPHFPNLRQIECFEDLVGAKGLKGLAESPSPFVLERLNLNSSIGYADSDDEEETSDTVAAVKVLTTHPRFASLTELGLPFNSLGEKCVALLLKSKTLAPGLRLGLGEDNLFDPDEYEDRLSKRFTVVDYL